jgi:hypothetical protein
MSAPNLWRLFEMKTMTALLALAVTLTSFAAAPAIALEGVKLAPGGGDHPRHPRGGYSPSTYHCGNDLGYLKRVYEEELDAVLFQEDVSVVPVCENDDYGLMRSDGNAGAIRQHIAANDAMTEALDAANFRVEDIVGVRMTGDESVILYVHTFHR